MNIEEYISSGVLEQFVLGNLSSKEEAEVMAYVKDYPEVAAEIERIEFSLEEFAEQHKQAPSADFKAKLFANLNSLAEESHSDVNKGKVIPLTDQQVSTNGKFVRLLAVAASILLLVSVGVNIYQQKQLVKSESKLNELIAEKEVLANQSDKIKTQLNSAEEKIKRYQNPDVTNVLIEGSQLSPESYAFVSWNKKTKKAILNGAQLPKNPSDKQYQLWALIDGQPIDMGVFESGEELTTLLEAEGNPSAFAVTLEDRGGKPTPNLDQLYLIGNV